MKRIVMLGTALLAALAFVAVNVVSVSASGHEFIASRTGKVKGKGTNTQIFKTGAGTIECAEASSKGEVKAGTSTTHKEVLTYGSCVGFGVGIKISPAHFEFNANGPATLEKAVTITPEGLGCEVILEPQKLESLGYTDSSGGTVTASANVVNIHSIPTGGYCGTKENTEGSYTGSIRAELESGTLEWK